jgi:hypothetical protein
MVPVLAARLNTELGRFIQQDPIGFWGPFKGLVGQRMYMP